MWVGWDKQKNTHKKNMMKSRVAAQLKMYYSEWLWEFGEHGKRFWGMICILKNRFYVNPWKDEEKSIVIDGQAVNSCGLKIQPDANVCPTWRSINSDTWSATVTREVQMLVKRRSVARYLSQSCRHPDSWQIRSFAHWKSVQHSRIILRTKQGFAEFCRLTCKSPL